MIAEMTFLDNRCTVEEARRFGHMYLNEIVQRAEILEHNKHVVFIYCNARYSAEDI